MRRRWRLIESWPDWPGRAVVLVGPEGSGKSHLAAIWAAEAARASSPRARSARPTCRPRSRPARSWSRTSRPGAFDERALFHLHQSRARGGGLPPAHGAHARRPAGRSASAISARGSRRCRWSTLAPPDDALLRAVLVKLFADRQLDVDESLIGYVATRIERSFAAARAAVARLDQRSDAPASGR